MYIEITDEQYDTLRKLGMSIKKFDLDKYMSDKIKINKEKDDIMEQIRVLVGNLGSCYYTVNYMGSVDQGRYDTVTISRYNGELKLSYSWHDKTLYSTKEEAIIAATPIREQYAAKIEAEKIQNLLSSRVSKIEMSIREALDKGYITENEYKTLDGMKKKSIFVPIIKYIKTENDNDRKINNIGREDDCPR